VVSGSHHAAHVHLSRKPLPFEGNALSFEQHSDRGQVLVGGNWLPMMLLPFIHAFWKNLTCKNIRSFDLLWTASTHVVPN
jgi:hypothetical protein